MLPRDSKRITCSDTCRKRRYRRRRHARAQAGRASGEARALSPEQEAALEDVAHQVVAQELRPIVREAMLGTAATEALGQLVGLLPDVMTELATDIHDRDPVVRQKAHQFLLRYTLGHEKVLPTEDDRHAPLTVVLAPGIRPSDDAAAEASAMVEPEPNDLRECDTCHESKPESDFIGTALRCSDCVAVFQAKAAKYLEPRDAQESTP